ncbi:MAG: MFS transporter [Alphaproteobacteria bacterium]|nr:MFS transporter [Alphaproteobacteria bacterium]
MSEEAESQPVSRRAVVAAVMTAMFMVSVETTILAPVMPRIAIDLGGVEDYAWAFAAFLVTQTAGTVICGRLADAWGRRIVMLGGLAVFSMATIACGSVRSFDLFIAARAMQGVGAGAVLPTALTLIGDLFDVAERRKVQSWLSSVWIISGLGGPVLGAVIVSVLDWRWVFWFTLPLAALTMAIFLRALPARTGRPHVTVDWLGAAYFVPSVAGALIALNELGAGEYSMALASLALAAVALFLFGLHCRGRRHALIDLHVWLRPEILTANLVNLLISCAMLGVITYLPILLQAVQGYSQLFSGLTQTVMTVGWPVGTAVSSYFLVKPGFARVLQCGSAITFVAFTVFAMAAGSLPLGALGGMSFIAGLGIGSVSIGTMVLVQSAVRTEERGGATASNIFARTFGQSLGAVLAGVTVQLVLAKNGIDLSAEDLDKLVTVGMMGNAALGEALGNAVLAAFALMAAIAFLALLLALGLPRPRPEA